MKSILAVITSSAGVLHSVLTAEAFCVHLLEPNGGIFPMFIPGEGTNLLPYIAAIVAGTVATPPRFLC